MAKENICGKAFEELTPDEMNEYSGGAVTAVTTITTTTIPCTVGAGVVSLAASIVYFTFKD